ncbi:hypothetical protein [Rasiella sp. SM2506]|uniref:hypothetical protein n=1 Tax=Rasiella sp. SM2506 TaxID=3423914 RepID=UPI003D7A47DF
MIKLFRNIRKRLVTENKFSKYLLYAIGEIILVVIGILIALYLNNQQQEYSLQKQQETYLRLVKREMKSNLNALSEEKSQLSAKMENAYKVLNTMNSDSLINNLTEPDISQLINQFFLTDQVLNYENGALNQIIYSGGINNIKNDSIGGLIASWEEKINRVRLQEKQVAEATDNLKNYLYQNGDFRSLSEDLGYSTLLGIDISERTKGNKNLLRSKKFENYIFQFIGFSYSLHLTIYPDFEEEMQSLIGLIDQELTNGTER